MNNKKETKLYNTQKEKEKAILISVITNANQNSEDELLELKNLTEACNIDPIDSLTQNLDEVNPKTYIGSGKIDELKIMIADYDASIIICNDELTPAQIENLEEILSVSVFDRTYIILEIFKRRAKTKEAILQVEMASLKYTLPRLKGLRKGLSRQGGSGLNKGKGETQLEIDRRHIEDKIIEISHNLKDLANNRKNQRKRRNESTIFKICLAGYTNAGKSTLLNSLLEMQDSKTQVFEKDMLFATLETQTKLINQKVKFLLTDTVGFISKLPHSLVEAFKSTLEEITEADLILHIVDSSNKDYVNQIEVTNSVLKEIGVSNIPIIYCFNKQDKLEDYFYIPPQYENSIRISAKKKINLDKLLDKIINALTYNYHNCTLVLPYTKSNITNLILEQNGIINSIEYGDSIIINASLNDYLYNYLTEYIK